MEKNLIKKIIKLILKIKNEYEADAATDVIDDSLSINNFF